MTNSTAKLKVQETKDLARIADILKYKDLGELCSTITNNFKNVLKAQEIYDKSLSTFICHIAQMRVYLEKHTAVKTLEDLRQMHDDMYIDCLKTLNFIREKYPKLIPDLNS